MNIENQMIEKTLPYQKEALPVVLHDLLQLQP
jgi:hypothetical protein